MRPSVLFFAALLSTSALAQAYVDGPPPLHRIVYRNTLAGRINPLGASYDGRLMYRFRLFESSSLALRDNFIGAGLAITASPAFVNVGPYIEFQPLSVLGFWATYQYSRYFRTFGLFQSYPSAESSNFSDVENSRRAALPRTDPLSNYQTDGTQLLIGSDFQVKVWQIVIRNKARLIRSDYTLRAGDTVYYDQIYDVLAPNHGWFFTDDVDVLWQRADLKLMIGARYTGTTAFYDGRQYLAGEEQKNLNALHRVGPFAAYTFKVDDGAVFNNPTVFVLVQWWLMHRYRTGAVSSQAFPMLAIGFQFTGDLLPTPKKL